VRYLDEFADPALADTLIAEIHRTVTQPWSIMEVCGGQTHTIIRNGIDRLLPDEVRLVHGPGCPVCVTPLEIIDRALAIATRPDVVFCSFGDMLRVPGSRHDLFQVKAAGGDVRVVYSPLDAVELARRLPDRQVVLFAIGFETTAPADAMAVKVASEAGLDNFSVLVSHVLVPPAITAILDAPDCEVQGFLAAGHVCTVMGMRQYQPIVDRYRVPVVVTGFEPLDVLEGVRRVLAQLEAGRAELDNAYRRAVTADGNAAAQAVVAEVFEVCDRTWRGIGPIPGSGWRLVPALAAFDAAVRFGVDAVTAAEATRCRAGEVLQGHITPPECEAFGAECTPQRPLGAPMVSAEGACAAYHRYRRLDPPVGTGR
jgi:hydrogenase expression/formation protein HypD